MSRRELIRNRGLLGLLARDVVSMTGSQMTLIALPWFVLTTTGSPGRMAIVFAVESASMAVFGFLGGNVAARLGPRKSVIRWAPWRSAFASLSTRSSSPTSSGTRLDFAANE